MKRLAIIAIAFFLSSCRTTLLRQLGKPFWTHIEAPEPIGLQTHSTCGSSGGKMLAFGGIEADSNPPFNNRLMIYDADADSWKTSKDDKGPTPRNAASFLIHDGKMLIFSGETPQNEATADAYLYDIEKAQWEKNSEAAVFTARKQATLSSVGDKVILFGGKGTAPVQDWGLYDTQSKHWERKTATAGMEARVSHVAVPISDAELFIWGGFIDQQRRGDGFILSPSKAILVPIPASPLLSPRANARAVRVDDEIFIWGGATDDGNANSGAVFQIASRQWRPLPTIPDDRMRNLKGAELILVPNKGLLLVGGRFGSDAFNDTLWLFDFRKTQWRRLDVRGSFPGRLAHCVTAIAPEKIAVFGGLGYEEGTSSLDLFNGMWLLELRD